MINVACHSLNGTHNIVQGQGLYHIKHIRKAMLYDSDDSGRRFFGKNVVVPLRIKTDSLRLNKINITGKQKC